MTNSRQSGKFAACMGVLAGYVAALCFLAGTDPWLAGFVVYGFVLPATVLFVLIKLLTTKQGYALFAYAIAAAAYAALCSAAFKLVAVDITKTVRSDTWAGMRALFTVVFAAGAALPFVISFLMLVFSAIANPRGNQTNS